MSLGKCQYGTESYTCDIPATRHCKRCDRSLCDHCWGDHSDICVEQEEKAEVCGCKYKGPIQIVSCGEHNAAAKNLDRAQAMITRLEMSVEELKNNVEHLEAESEKLCSENDSIQEKLEFEQEVGHYTDHKTWEFAKELNDQLVTPEPLPAEPKVISFGKMREVITAYIDQVHGYLLHTTECADFGEESPQCGICRRIVDLNADTTVYFQMKDKVIADLQAEEDGQDLGGEG